MATRERFRLETRLQVAADNIAIDAILMVIEDAFGRGSVRSGPDADGNIVADIHCTADAIDARQVNWLHGQLATLAKYLLAGADVTCSDATGREQSYRLEPDSPPPRVADDESTGDASPAVDETEPASASD